MANPVHWEDSKWYFYNESWSDRFGPFENEADAQLLCESYAYSLETGESWDKDDLDKYLKITLLQFYYAGSRRTAQYTNLVIDVIDNLIG